MDARLMAVTDKQNPAASFAPDRLGAVYCIKGFNCCAEVVRYSSTRKWNFTLREVRRGEDNFFFLKKKKREEDTSINYSTLMLINEINER